MSIYIYKFHRKGNVIYVGITINLSQRIMQHKSQSDWYDKHDKIEYAELPNKFLAETFEVYLINKLLPEFNIKDKRNDDISLISFDEEKIKWHKYTPFVKLNKPLKKMSNYALSQLKKKLEYELKEKKAEENTIQFIRDNKGNIKRIYYECYNCLAVVFNEVGLINKSKYGLALYNADYSEGRMEGSCSVLNCIQSNYKKRIELILYFYDNEEKYRYKSYKDKLDRVYEVLEIDKLNLDRNEGDKLNKERIRLIKEKYSLWEKRDYTICLSNQNKSRKLNVKATEVFKYLDRVKTWGCDHLLLEFSNSEPSSFVDYFVNDDIVYFLDNKIENHFFWFMVEKKSIPLFFVESMHSKYPYEIVENVSHCYQDLFYPLEPEEVFI